MKKSIIDLRVVFSEEKLIRRIQDNCPKYDIASRIRNLNQESGKNGNSNLGTRIISELADDVIYLFSFDTNIVFLEYRNVEEK